MGQPIQPGDLQFITREYYLNGGSDTAKGSTLTFEELDTTLIYLSNSIANVTPNINTSSLLLTASVNLNTITFTKGDNTTQFDIIIDTGSGQTYTAGGGLNLNGNTFSSKVLTVNGQEPNGLGNISTALTAVLTGISASLVDSSSGTITGSITNGTVWVISGDSDPAKNGDTYIFKSGSIGQWYQISPLDEVSSDARYVRLVSTSTQTITSSLLISGSNVTFSSSLFWSGASDLGGSANYTLVLDDNGQIYKTGSYGGGGGGGTPGSPNYSFQYNDAGSFSGASNFTIDGNFNDTFNMTGSLIVSNSLNVIGTESITGSLSISSSTNGQTALRVVGTGSSTTNPLVQIAGQNGGFVQVYDSNSGSLLSVNTNAGTAIVDVRSNGQTLIGSNTYQGMYDSVGIAAFVAQTQSLTTPGYLTSSYNFLIMEYVAISGGYGQFGTFTALMSGSIYNSSTGTSRTFGSLPPSGIDFEISMSGQYYQIIAKSTTNNWFIKGIVRGI